ncbi:hypothetical protein Hanom_Chr16g01511361 [Helianthus anomalus]
MTANFIFIMMSVCMLSINLINHLHVTITQIKILKMIFQAHLKTLKIASRVSPTTGPINVTVSPSMITATSRTTSTVGPTPAPTTPSVSREFSKCLHRQKT